MTQQSAQYIQRKDGSIVKADGTLVPTNPNDPTREAYDKWVAAGNKPQKEGDDNAAQSQAQHQHADKSDRSNR